MKTDPLFRAVLLLITLFLGLIAIRPLVAPPNAHAESEPIHDLYIEPGSTMVTSPDGSQNVPGKVVVDLTNGNVWGFPTGWTGPYPKAHITGKPPVVVPIYLGRFDLDAINR